MIMILVGLVQVTKVPPTRECCDPSFLRLMYTILINDHDILLLEGHPEHEEIRLLPY